MGSRLELHEELCELLGSRNVYFQPPESLKMQYPCIRYSKTNIDIRSANNRAYKTDNQYQVITIDHDTDSDICARILNHFPMSRFDRSYTASNLNHNVITLYF